MTNSASPLTDGEKNFSLFNCHFSFVIEKGDRGDSPLCPRLVRFGRRAARCGNRLIQLQAISLQCHSH
jgi:hypothetical protein